MKDAGVCCCIAAAFEDPTAKNQLTLIRALTTLTRQFTDIKGLPILVTRCCYCHNLFGQALKQFEGGIDSVGEAVQVGNAAATVGALLGNQAMATAAGFLGPAVV